MRPTKEVEPLEINRIVRNGINRVELRFTKEVARAGGPSYVGGHGRRGSIRIDSDVPAACRAWAERQDRDGMQVAWVVWTKRCRDSVFCWSVTGKNRQKGSAEARWRGQRAHSWLGDWLRYPLRPAIIFLGVGAIV